ncbi:hypothetical protein KKG41_03050 [Patescibacteria group bacterium]|nr:hypothetical protein [Patescibacteria group bacterium]MBU1890249.1 hypothetical protein [Patescibacteria group bacterium]
MTRTIKQVQTLRNINAQLRTAMQDPHSMDDVNELGAINNALVTAIIINIASLFDRDERVASLYKILIKSKVDYWCKENHFFKKIIEVRNKFEAHKEIKYLEDGKFGVTTSYLIDSTNERYLQDVLDYCQNLKK